MTIALFTLALGLSAATPVEIVTHRGASFDAPENTVAAIQLAWAQKADGSEFDVYLSKDGKIVVLHDRDLKRTAGVDRKVTDLTLDELKKLDVGRWKAESFAGERVPTLDEMLATVPDGKRVFIEVKCGPEIVGELDRVLKASRLKPAQTAVISFSDEVVAAVKKARPDLAVYWIVSLGRRDGQQPPTAASLIARAKEIKADGLDLSATPAVLTPDYARAIKAAGLGLYVWTVNDADVARAMVAAGVEGITTDRPAWLRERLAEAPGTVRVMSYNIRYANADDGPNAWPARKDFLVNTVRAFDPDLLGTQETLASQRDDLAAKLNGYDLLAAGREDGKDRGEMMALFYRKARFEKLDGGHFWLSETPDQVGSKSWDSSLPRMVTWVKLRDRSAPELPPIAAFNTHFDHRGPRARLESARLLRRQVDALARGCRVVLTGDFNTGEGSEPYRALFGPGDAGSRPLVDTFRTAHPTRGEHEGTFSGFRAASHAGNRIDWIAGSTDWAVRASAIDRTAKDGRTPSDHYAVTAVLAPQSAETSGRAPLRVLSYNIHHGEGTDGKVDLPRLAAVIKAARPDLVALQEVDRNTRRTGQVDQTAELARLTGLHGAFGKQIDFEGGEYGQAVLSRFPIDALTVHWLPGTPDRERRIAAEARLKVDGKDLSFVTTHLHHLNAEFRAQQVAALSDLFRSSARPVILAGDFNATPEAPPLTLLARDWTLATTARSLLTYPAGQPAKMLDYIAYQPSARFRVLEATVLDAAVASDHRPVLAVLEGSPE